MVGGPQDVAELRADGGPPIRSTATQPLSRETPTWLVTQTPIEVVNHPLVQHKLTMVRDRNTGAADFRQLLREISHLLAYEVCRDLDTEAVEIETPLEVSTGPKLGGRKICLVSILRAGNGLLDGMLDRSPLPVWDISVYIGTRIPRFRSNIILKCPTIWINGSASWSIRCWQPVDRPSQRYTG